MSNIQDRLQKLDSWGGVKKSLELFYLENTDYCLNRYAYRGSIYLVEFGENLGSEICKKRPGLVISPNRYNINSGSVLVIPLTTKLKYDSKGKSPKYSYNYFLFKNKYPFLNFDSCVKCEQVRNVSKIRIKKWLGNLDDKDLYNISLKLSSFILD